MSPELAGGFFTTSAIWEAPNQTCTKPQSETELGSWKASGKFKPTALWIGGLPMGGGKDRQG